MIRRVLIIAIVALCLGGAMAELFDRWDQTSADGNDTEVNVVIVALCFGTAFAAGTGVIVNRIRAVSSTLVPRRYASPAVVHPAAFVLAPLPTGSPPIVLRI